MLLFLIFVVLRCLVNLLLALEVDLPDVVRHCEYLALICHFLRQLRQDILRGHRREEPMSSVRTLLVVFQVEQDCVWVVALALSKFRVRVPPVDLVANGVATAWLRLNVRLHGLFAILLLLSDGLV